MMKHEFEERLGYGINDKEYKIIEHVYNWHPTFDTMPDAKQGIADLYKNYGILTIKSMTEVANAMAELNALETKVQTELLRIREKKQRIVDGDLALAKEIVTEV